MDIHRNAKAAPLGRRLMVPRLADGRPVAGRWPGSPQPLASRPGPWARGRPAPGSSSMPASTPPPPPPDAPPPRSCPASARRGPSWPSSSGPGLVRRLGRHRRAGHDRPSTAKRSIRPRRSVRARAHEGGCAWLGHAFRAAGAAARVKRKRTTPDTPRTNGRAERFIQTAMRAWAHRQPFASSSAERTAATRPWRHGCHRRRPRAALAGPPPFTRLPKDNLLGNDR
jgi:hypothetical protein